MECPPKAVRRRRQDFTMWVEMDTKLSRTEHLENKLFVCVSVGEIEQLLVTTFTSTTIRHLKQLRCRWSSSLSHREGHRQRFHLSLLASSGPPFGKQMIVYIPTSFPIFWKQAPHFCCKNSIYRYFEKKIDDKINKQRETLSQNTRSKFWFSWENVPLTDTSIKPRI